MKILLNIILIVALLSSISIAAEEEPKYLEPFSGIIAKPNITIEEPMEDETPIFEGEIISGENQQDNQASDKLSALEKKISRLETANIIIAILLALSIIFSIYFFLKKR